MGIDWQGPGSQLLTLPMLAWSFISQALKLLTCKIEILIMLSAKLMNAK